jgi:hypothetical protein
MSLESDVLLMLIPTGGWITRGPNFEDIEFVEATPITKKQFEQGKVDYPEYLAKLEAEKATVKEATVEEKLENAGLTVAELKAALGL